MVRSAIVSGIVAQPESLLMSSAVKKNISLDAGDKKGSLRKKSFKL